ncbi:Oxygen-dependent choline dehydrogenase [Halotydeus destructor]|nr:Oxygen-dependent choline dehydrogenase [Halotydeus destructor]
MEVTSFLTLLLALAEDLTYNEGQARSIQVPLDSYDYIIVGAGATGATLAARLSQDLTTMVLLIDTAGSSTRPSDIPYIFSFWHLANTTLAHNYVTEKQPNVCHVTSDGECLLAVGRALGGGTAVNAMTYVRGNKLDYDSYAALGLPTWSYDKVLPFFKKFENSINIKSKYRGTDGPVNVTTDQWRFLEDLTNRWVSAGVEQYGVGQSDYNGKTQKAFSRLQRLIYRGIRQSTDRCYLQPLDQKRSNLHVLTYSLVTKVVFEGTKAVGVEYVSVREYDNNTKTTVKARKEVIISSGTFGSPKLLLLSGIGPKAHLDDVGIKVVADRPGVGQNLQDPILVQVNFDTNKTYPLDGYITETNYRAWLTQGASILRSSTLCGLAFLPSIRSTSDPDDIRTEYTFDFVMGSCQSVQASDGRVLL